MWEVQHKPTIDAQDAVTTKEENRRTKIRRTKAANEKKIPGDAAPAAMGDSLSSLLEEQ